MLAAIFPNVHYIYVFRRDKVRQAISLHRAVQTQQWALFDDAPRSPVVQPAFDFAAIEQYRQNILSHETAWQRFFDRCDVTPFTLVYEEFVLTYEATTQTILDYLNIPMPSDLFFGPRHLRRQADNLTEEWLRRYYEEAT